MFKRTILALISIIFTVLLLEIKQALLIPIYLLVFPIYKSCISGTMECIQTAKYGISGTAELYSCESHWAGRSLTKNYYPVLSFYYKDKVLYREPIGHFNSPPCKVGEIVDIVYNEETDCIMLVNEKYEHYKSLEYKPFINIDNKDIIIAISTTVLSSIIYFLVFT